MQHYQKFKISQVNYKCNCLTECSDQAQNGNYFFLQLPSDKNINFQTLICVTFVQSILSSHMSTVCDVELHFITHITSVTVKQDATKTRNA
jgi:hypothetical protein